MNALTKFSIALLLLVLAMGASAIYLNLAPGDVGFGAVGSQPQDPVCKQDGERLSRLQANPSLDEGLRFVSEIQCLQLWPQLQTVMDRLTSPSGSTASPDPNGVGSEAISASAAHTIAAGGPASAALNEACRRDEDRLAELQASPSIEAAVRFDNELKCPRLQPQLPTILAQLSHAGGSVQTQSRKAPAPNTTSDSEAATSATSDDTCKRDEDRLAKLQAVRSFEETVRFVGELKCFKLQPQLLALLDGLRAAPQPVEALSTNEARPNTASAAAFGPTAPETAQSAEGPDSRNARSSAETGPPAPPPPDTEVKSATLDDACKQDEERLAHLRTTPSSEEATRFAQELRCEALRPQLVAVADALAKPSPPDLQSVSHDAGVEGDATNEALPAPQAAVDADRRIAELESEKEALAAKVSQLEGGREASTADEANSAPPRRTALAEGLETQPNSQVAADAQRRVAQLESENEALTAEVSRLQHDRESSIPEQTNAASLPPPSPVPVQSETQPAPQPAADAERRIAELESEKQALAAKVSQLEHDRQASPAEQAAPVPPSPPIAPAERSDPAQAAALASLPAGMPARVLIRYLANNADARAQADRLSNALTRQGVEVIDLRPSASAIRTELSFAYAPDEAIAQQVARLVGVAPVRRPQPKDGLMVRPGTVELNLSGESHLAAIKATSSRESNHE